MHHPTVEVNNLGKRYRLGTIGATTLRDSVERWWNKVLNGSRRTDVESKEIFWALRGVSFTVERGEVLGILGRNGAGKSTLLKILSRITEPTEGSALLRGRVASLLEVGTGFHPELSGRENIFLNGAMLGMKRVEIMRKFDEIVAFAEVDQFIDTPVKRYSSGMYVRLAFAVAAHLEPDILIVDEVLAVGDLQFQRKCIGKMQDVSRQDGRTVFFVSHNMDAIQRLCGRCLLLENGSLAEDGPAGQVVTTYISKSCAQARPGEWINLTNVERRGSGEARFAAAQYSSLRSDIALQPYSGGPLEIDVLIESDRERSVGSIAVTIYTTSGTKLVNADTLVKGHVVNLREGRNHLRFRIDELHLNSGVYRLGLWLSDPIRSQSTRGAFDFVENAFDVEVVSLETAVSGVRPGSAVPCEFNLLEIA